MKRAIPRLRDWFVASFSILLACLLTQAILYSYRNKFDSVYSRVGEERLYAIPPCLENITYYGSGQIGLKFVLGGGGGYLTQNNKQRTEIAENKELFISLHSGDNLLTVDIDSNVKGSLRFNYIPAESYKLAGNFDYPSGVVILKDSSLCIGRPIFSDSTLWNYQVGDQKYATGRGLLGVGAIEKVIAGTIIDLEGKRGTPTSEAESASISQMREMVQSNRSQVWCSQIAAYTVTNLSSSVGVRLVTSNGTLLDSGVLAGGHAFLEVIDSEKNKWTLVDPTNYILRVSMEDGTPLSARDLQRLIALDQPDLLRALIFRIVDPVNGNINSIAWDKLNDKIKEYVLLYFSPMSKIYYHAGESVMYTKDIYGKVDNWIRIDRRFIISHIGDFPFLAWIRVSTFYLVLISLGVCVVLLALRFMRIGNGKG